jgi:hypothetical protein
MSDLLLHLCQWISSTRFSVALHESTYMFPLIETIHTLGIMLVVGTIAVLDLRLLGLVMKRTPVSDIARQVLPWVWSGFVVMLITGILLTIAEAEKNYFNIAFRIKLVLLFLVGLNPLIFHLTIYRSVNTWDIANVTPRRARMAAICSIVLWTGIIVAGRMVAYLDDMNP